ncbi:hypothetical protein [Chamaesiphon polymorphus]|uniref:Uncharacterized protein n=1 Tax=Chamaesiphon polymorphus CCALA 037 TaxID=2107692 RepID=A0A2T1GJ87_9CYAN|nr:hypothetical protein [Chamaesiphon polymorphus]PSB57837.1 hypothetical protein C7B77_07050 [Chamaesiphon polymorphus CCALA 037]
MTFSQSNLNLLPESLFKELTADQAQMLEGGKRVDILSVKCITTGDTDGTDELFFNINGKDLQRHAPLNMKAGRTANAGMSANIPNDSLAVIQLFDKKNSGGALLVGKIVDGAINDTFFTLRAKANGGEYDVTYRITNKLF